MRVGDVVCAKSIEHREVVEMREDKNGKQKPRVNRFGFRFQPEHSLLSQVGVFLYLGQYPEQEDAEKTFQFAQQQLERLGWATTTKDETAAAASMEREA